MPERKTDAPLRLPISGIYKIKGVGDVLAGRVEQGIVKPGDEVIFMPTHTAANKCEGKVSRQAWWVSGGGCSGAVGGLGGCLCKALLASPAHCASQHGRHQPHPPPSPSFHQQVFTVEMHHKRVEKAGPGDNVGMNIKGLDKARSGC